MTPEGWVALTLALVLGAMSPGPSLALVLRNTMSGGRRHGVLTGLGHGIGFGVYAFSTAAGMAIALAAHRSVAALLRWGGAALLLWLGITFIRQASDGAKSKRELEQPAPSGRMAFIQGFLVALFSPKIMAWMLAIYAPFIKPGAPMRTSLAMSVLATCTDASWYITVAAVLSGTGAIRALRARAHIVHGAMGALMLLFAALLASGIL
jgi:threonine/homoserine/homoserine lactone efflux protein